MNERNERMRELPEEKQVETEGRAPALSGPRRIPFTRSTANAYANTPVQEDPGISERHKIPTDAQGSPPASANSAEAQADTFAATTSPQRTGLDTADHHAGMQTDFKIQFRHH